jgi:uncharacterized protein (AIM24 family)
MSKIALTPNASGTGTFTFAAPGTNTDRTLTLPDASGTLATTADSITQTQLATALNASGSAPIYACRAWVNFNGTGTVAIRASGNVSSITDNGTGDYTVNFTTAMTDANYAALASGKFDATTTGDGIVFTPYSYATSSVRVNANNSVGTKLDSVFVNVAIFR